MVMLKQSYRYDQTSTRQEVEGLPDLSAGQGDQAIGILSSWRLMIVGGTEVQGRREHLESLMRVVIPYVRLRLSGVVRSVGDEGDPVRIIADGIEHRLDLISGQPDVPPLSIRLDVAELAIWCAVLMPFGSTPASAWTGHRSSMNRCIGAILSNASPDPTSGRSSAGEPRLCSGSGCFAAASPAARTRSSGDH